MTNKNYQNAFEEGAKKPVRDEMDMLPSDANATAMGAAVTAPSAATGPLSESPAKFTFRDDTSAPQGTAPKSLRTTARKNFKIDI
jgi:hypothetical protein